MLESLTKTVEDLATKLATAEAKLSEYEAERERKRMSFTVKELLHDLKLIVPTEHMKRFGSDIKKKFDEKSPASRTFLKDNAVSYCSTDRAMLESLVLNEHRFVLLRTLEVGPVKANEGFTELELEEICSSGDVSEDSTLKYELMLEPQPPVVANVGVDLNELETQL